MFKRYILINSLFLVGILLSPLGVNAHASTRIMPFESLGSFILKSTTLKNSPDGEAKNLKGEGFKSENIEIDEANPKTFWHLLDSKSDSVEGASALNARALLYRPSDLKEVIVAVIDGGVDIKHHTLKDHIWINPKEIAGNDFDNDGDGFKNDLNGWNFIGDLDSGTLESTREIKRLADKAANNHVLTKSETEYYSRLNLDMFNHRAECESTIRDFEKKLKAFQILEHYGFPNVTLEMLSAIPSSPLELQNAKNLVANLLVRKVSLEYVNTVLESKRNELQFAYNPNFDESSVIHDHATILDEKNYGSPDVIGPNPLHGTHVAGIILSQAPNVKIMPIRVVPDGDERDKDVGNAIRYAVDHGARIINMSFGKAFSPNQAYVDAAIEYAEKHNVLLVHAAGNDSKDNDKFDQNFPNQKIPGRIAFASNWIEVGASSKKTEIDFDHAQSLAAEFSNYGKYSVDLFAQGTEIVSTSPGDHFARLQGTSMAAPQVAGVAALLLGLRPNLTAKALKTILMTSATRYKNVTAVKPGTWANIAAPGEDLRFSGIEVPFSDLSTSGGVLNAFNAVSLLLKK